MKSTKVLMSLLALNALAAMPAYAALCDDTLNLQGATQPLFTGTDPNNLARTAKGTRLRMAGAADTRDPSLYLMDGRRTDAGQAGKAFGSPGFPKDSWR